MAASSSLVGGVAQAPRKERSRKTTATPDHSLPCFMVMPSVLCGPAAGFSLPDNPERRLEQRVFGPSGGLRNALPTRLSAHRSAPQYGYLSGCLS